LRLEPKGGRVLFVFLLRFPLFLFGSGLAGLIGDRWLWLGEPACRGVSVEEEASSGDDYGNAYPAHEGQIEIVKRIYLKVCSVLRLKMIADL
jgi:hypothetical protein